MESMDQLRREHDAVYSFVEVLNLAGKTLREGRRPAREFFDEAVEFARDYVDRYHHGKEEMQAFVLLAQRQSGRLDGLIDTLRQQHERGRENIAAIAGQLAAYERGEDHATRTIADEIEAYTTMLAEHAYREDSVLFPMAKQVLTDEDDRALMTAFARLDERFGPHFVEDHLELVRMMRLRVLRAIRH
jgi:hemerythrin-like domain-containing protein